jgi:hypothetical protein
MPELLITIKLVLPLMILKLPDIFDHTIDVDVFLSDMFCASRLWVITSVFGRIN